MVFYCYLNKTAENGKCIVFDTLRPIIIIFEIFPMLKRQNKPNVDVC